MRTTLPISLLLLLMPLTVLAGGPGWTGRTVLLKGDKEVKIGVSDAKGNQIYRAILKGISYVVIAEKDGFLKVAQDDTEGWFSKTDAVVLEEAAAYFTTRLSANPRDDQALGYRAEAAMLMGDPASMKSAFNDLSEAIKIRPTLAIWWNNRAFVNLVMKDYDKGLADVNEALKLDPKLLRGYLVRGLIYAEQKQFAKAIAEYDTALRQDPKFLDALYHRASTRFELKQYPAALKDYDDLLRAQPKHVDGLNDVAWILATCPADKLRDGKRALELAKTLNALTMEKNPGHLDTLAAAYAELGLFPEAVRTMKVAIALAADPQEFPADLRESFQKRLRLYEEKKKFRDE